MPRIETYRLKVGGDVHSIDIMFSTKSQRFRPSGFPIEVITALDLKEVDLEFKTYQELLDAMGKHVDLYIPLITEKEKVILVKANVTGKARNEFEDSFNIDMFKDVKASNEFSLKYGFLTGSGNDISEYPSISFRYFLAYRLRLGNHVKYYTVDSFNEGEVEWSFDVKEWNTMVLEYSPETEIFVQDFQGALEKLSKKLIDFFIELKTDTQKCIAERKKFLEIGE